MSAQYLRRQRRPKTPRATSLAELPAVLAAAPVQPALFEPTPTGEASLAALAEILDAPATHHAPSMPLMRC